MKTSIIIMFVGILLFSTSLSAQQFIYPNKNQSPEQQQQDEGECYVWAKGQTGFDPANPPQVAAAPAPERKRGGVIRGAVVGAAVGEIVDDEAGKGAAAGGLMGGARQARKNREAQQQQQTATAANQAEIDQQRATYSRAFGACMEGRGYTVK